MRCEPGYVGPSVALGSDSAPWCGRIPSHPSIGDPKVARTASGQRAKDVSRRLGMVNWSGV